MSQYASIKPKLLDICVRSKRMFEQMGKNLDLTRLAVEHIKRLDPAITTEGAFRQIQDERVGFLEIENYASRSQTVVFPAEQAQVFSDVTRDYVESLDFRLPFPYVILQFTKSVPVLTMNRRVSDEPTIDHLMAILLFQQEITNDFIKQRNETRQKFESNPFNLLSIPKSVAEVESGFSNRAIAVWSDWNISRFGWFSESSSELANDPPNNEVEAKVQESWAGIKRLAIACIGYINCENVYLHREDVPEAINAKRERKGKSRLEPYYVCRIRGVQYDGNGATGTGAAHGIRYDVRGHFRRLTNGKTTWVRAHQRGLANELYIPKIYKVDK